jgi:hypothetical protein
MPDALQAYYAEIRAVEDEYFNLHCRKGRRLGSSVWSANPDRLREIDERHGIRPDDPRVYSIAAYQAERRQIDEEWGELWKGRKWDQPDLDEDAQRALWAARNRYRARLDDCRARHFPNLHHLQPATIDTIPKLWAHIALHLTAVAEHIQGMHASPSGHRPVTGDEYVERAYGLLHELKIPWAPAPPYPSFTQREARDELTRLANLLEREDAERCRRLTGDRTPADLRTPTERAMSDGHLPTRALQEQFRQIDEARREKNRPIQEEQERRYRCEDAVHAFANALYPVLEHASRESHLQRAFDPSPHIPDIAARLGEAIEALRATGRLALLDDLDLDGACQQGVGGGFGPKEKVRPALDCAAQLLRETPVDPPSVESLVRELWFDPALYPAGQTLHLLLRILSGMNRFDRKRPAAEADGGGADNAQAARRPETAGACPTAAPPTGIAGQAGIQPPLDPATEAIMARARTAEAHAVEMQRAHVAADARLRRARHAWERVRSFKGDRIPANLTGDAWLMEDARLVVELGRVLKDDGWQCRVDAVPAGNDAKTYALTILRRAMGGDVHGVAGLLREAVNTMFTLGLGADGWLREGLMYEVLDIRPAPEAPPHWEGAYLESIETVEDLVRWIDQELFIALGLARTQGDRQGGGQAVRNAYRLVDKLGLLGLPQQPLGPLTFHQEEAVLRNLQRECRRRLAEEEESGPPVDVAGEGKAQGRTGPPVRASEGQPGEVEPPNADKGDPTTSDFIPIASDVPDLGKADSISELWDWCNARRDGLRQFRVRLGLPAPSSVATAEFRVIPEIVRQCRNYLIGFGVENIPDCFAFPGLPYDQTPAGPERFPSAMEGFLVWAGGYRCPGHGIMELIGNVEDFLTWAMGWCLKQKCRTERRTPPAEDVKTPPPPPAQEWLFVPSGDGYYITGFGESGHLSGRKGLPDLARLIQTPGRLAPMLELEGANQQLKQDRRGRQPAVDVKGLQQAGKRLRELRADLEKAQEDNSTVEADTIRAEIEQLEACLAPAKGFGGKARDLNNLFDKLRPRIHGRLRSVYEAMRKADPPMNKLAEHFELSISCEGGSAFIYRPAGDPPPWQFRRAPKK